jgi:aspartate dehydrogenase
VSPARQDAVRVGVIGAGAIGTVIADEIRAGRVARMTLAGVVAGRQTPRDQFQALLETCDVIVEVASHAAVAEYGPAVKEAAVDLVVLSAGALVDDSLLGTLSAPSGGRLLISTGACGGIELLRAAHLVRPLDEARLRTTKTSAALVRDWMEPDLRRKLSEGKEPLTVFAGTAREAVKLFP